MNTYEKLNAELKDRKDSLLRVETENRLRRREIETCEKKISECGRELVKVKEAGDFLTTLANARRSGARGVIEKSATDALQAVYGDGYGVKLDASVKANRSSLDVLVVRQTEAGVVERGIEGVGGGVADTVSLPLRLMVLAGSDTDRVAVLDECWKHLDVNRIGSVGKLLKNVSNGLGLQIIFATHHHGLEKYADSVYTVSEDGGTSKVLSEK